MVGLLTGLWMILLLAGRLAIIVGIAWGTSNYFNVKWVPQAPTGTIPVLTLGGLLVVWIARSLL